MDIEIKKGIKIPGGVGSSSGMTARFRAVIKKMEVGDSFEFEAKDYITLRVVSSTIHNDPDDKRRFITRKLNHKIRGCWRVE